MPRDYAKEKWDIELSPEDFYKSKPDPFNIINNYDESKKAFKIIELINDYNKIFWNGIDIGCGEGYFTKAYSRFCVKFDACDLSITALERAKKEYPNINFFEYDLTSNNSINKKYDLVICNEVLYYIKPEKLQTAINNIYNILDKNSILILTISQYYTFDDLIKLFDKLNLTIKNKFSFRDSYCLIIEGRLK